MNKLRGIVFGVRHWCWSFGTSVRANAHDYAHFSYFVLVFVESHGLYRYAAGLLAVMTIKAVRAGRH